MPIITITLDGKETKVEVKVESTTPVPAPEPIQPPVITGE